VTLFGVERSKFGLGYSKANNVKHRAVSLRLRSIGVIYGVGYTKGTETTFWTDGIVPLTFQDKKVKNLLSPAVNRGSAPWTPPGELTLLPK